MKPFSLPPFARNISVLLLSAFFAVQAFASNAKVMDARRAAYAGAQPKYIFLFIGDGYGTAQSEGAEAFLATQQNQTGIIPLEMNKMPVFGLCSTFAANRFITDSAAAGTALASGHKTSCGTLGMNADWTKPLESMAEYAKKNGRKVGIVTSVSIDHATPAAFYAHQAERGSYYDIALQLSASNFDYFGGGGFVQPDGDPKAATPVENCIRVAEKRGYRYVDTKEGFQKLANSDGKIIAVAPRLVVGQAIPYAIDQKEGDITLADFTRKGIELLDGSAGFFMMVEGGKIDWACHANDISTTLREVIDFDQAVQVAVAFAAAHPDETLIVVTSDHETGGLGLGYAGTHYESNIALLSCQKVSSETFSGIVDDYRKTHVDGGDQADGLALVKEYFGLGDASQKLELTADEKSQLCDAFAASMKGGKATDNDDKERFYLLYGGYEPLTVTACRILARRAGVAWTSYVHTASPVPVRAIGTGSEMFSGYIDNTDVANNIFRLMGKAAEKTAEETR